MRLIRARAREKWNVIQKKGTPPDFDGVPFLSVYRCSEGL